MPKKKRPEDDPKEQFKRFTKAADEVDVSPKEAEDAFKRIARKDSKK